MDLFTTLIADLLLLPYYLLTEGICKCFSLHVKPISISIQNLIQCFCRFGQPIKVNWAYASGQREDTSGWFRF